MREAEKKKGILTFIFRGTDHHREVFSGDAADAVFLQEGFHGFAEQRHRPAHFFLHVPFELFIINSFLK